MTFCKRPKNAHRSEDVRSMFVRIQFGGTCIPPNAGTSRAKLKPLGVAVVMQYDGIVLVLC